MARLTDEHVTLMGLIHRREMKSDALLSARELCDALWQNPGWAGPKLRGLAVLGLVETAGRTFSGARTWRLTEKGRTFLNERDAA
jgi:hypothetical protein